MMAACAIASNLTTTPDILRDIKGVEFSECDNSLSGVHTFSCRGDNGEYGIVAVTDGGAVSGTLYGTDGEVYDISNALTDKPVRTLIDAASFGSCGVDDEAVAESIRRAAADEGYIYPSDSYTEIYDEDLNRNTGRVYVYRAAIPFTYLTYKGYPGYKNKDNIYAKWAELEAFFNKTFGRQLSIRLEVIKDDRLIITDETDSWPGSTSSNYVYAVGTSSISELIDEDEFDVGIIVTQISTSSGDNGAAALAGVYNKKLKANAVANAYVSTITHELGHLFGSNHTGNTVSGYRTEPGAGTSIMSYADYNRNEFSFVSAYRIRHCLAMNSYYADAARTQLVENPDNVNGYTNFPYAIQTDNQAPILETKHLRHSYTIPQGSLFQFDLKASDADGDELKYNALQADVYNSERGFTTYNPKLAYEDESTASCVKFQPKWEYSYTGKSWSIQSYTDARTLPVGTYRFWLQVNDGRDDKEHGVGYSAYETKVNVVAGTAFDMTGSYASAYKAGDRVALTWNVDTDVFGDDSRVRILLSDDFGTTWKYVLNPNAPNSGSAEVILPQMEIGKVYYGDAGDGKQVRAGVIKVEVVDNVAYAVTALSPVDSSNSMTGGFTLGASDITFKNTPERYVEVDDLKALPEVADVKAYAGATELTVSYTETTSNGYYVSRIWEAESNGTKAAFEQILALKSDEGSTSISEVEVAPAAASDDATYDLLGRRVGSLEPGHIYIRNGRKFRI
jgi:hypothetical protein